VADIISNPTPLQHTKLNSLNTITFPMRYPRKITPRNAYSGLKFHVNRRVAHQLASWP